MEVHIEFIVKNLKKSVTYKEKHHTKILKNL